MKQITWLLLPRALALCLLLVTNSWAETNQPDDMTEDQNILIVRPLVGTGNFQNRTVQWQVLDLALQKSGRKYDLDISKVEALPGRKYSQMETLGDDGNLIWSSATPWKEEEFLPVRMPITRGLGSYWYIWVREAELEQFANVKSLDDLKGYTVLQGPGWPANAVLEAEGFEVLTANNQHLPRMLEAGRGDVFFFPGTGTPNLRARDENRLNITPLDHVVIYFPTDHFYYLHHDSVELYDALQKGMLTIAEDKSHEALLREYPGTKEVIQKLSSEKPAVINLENTNITEETLGVLDKYSYPLFDG